METPNNPIHGNPKTSKNSNLRLKISMISISKNMSLPKRSESPKLIRPRNSRDLAALGSRTRRVIARSPQALKVARIVSERRRSPSFCVFVFREKSDEYQYLSFRYIYGFCRCFALCVGWNSLLWCLFVAERWKVVNQKVVATAYVYICATVKLHRMNGLWSSTGSPYN